ncbi:MAG: carbohydrate kinase, partial [Clostridiales bacterium]|nr:carbohydrate kinase [Clostridiales bacterium]
VNISGKTNPTDIADEFFKCGVKNVAIKLGKDGCYIKTADKKEFTIPTFLNIKAVETTGAGDAFSSGFITGILKGWPLDKCGLFANAVGTFSVSQVGASTGIKSLKKTIAFIKSEGREW